MTTPTSARGLTAHQAAVLLLATALLLVSFVVGYLAALFSDGFAEVRAHGWKGFERGEPMQALARDLRVTPVASWFGQRVREAGWLLLGDLGPRVRQGCAGWLFLADEWQFNPAAEAAWQERVELARRSVESWKARGVQVVMAVVPDKSRIEDQHRCGLVRPARLADRYDRWLAAMRRVGVSVVDLRPSMREVQQQFGAAFERTDTHWRWQGSRASAVSVAQLLRTKGFTPSADWRISYTIGSTASRWGDLVRLAGIDALPAKFLPPPDNVEQLRFDVATGSNPKLATEEALFGDAPTATMVSLVGTSFSRNGQFADFLAWASQSEVLNLARDGGGFAQSMNDAWQRWMDKPAAVPFAWMVWEVTERALEEPLGEAERTMGTQLRLERKPASGGP